VRGVLRLAKYLRRPPDTATVEDLRNFQLHLVDRGTSPCNSAPAGTRTTIRPAIFTPRIPTRIFA